ncbi:hypothetical protein PoB_000102200 [Plakobranchus ocellatus]|uniref:Uncharacterized protein n=1 Tax=Plakobranchus ocellatus TaxID=259542 RepID=A0AAV3XWJ7_9GAST|nr:hypothetical protein PoB_000102200 [Plakobranchus ocellatus]
MRATTSTCASKFISVSIQRCTFKVFRIEAKLPLYFLLYRSQSFFVSVWLGADGRVKQHRRAFTETDFRLSSLSSQLRHSNVGFPKRLHFYKITWHSNPESQIATSRSDKLLLSSSSLLTTLPTAVKSSRYCNFREQKNGPVFECKEKEMYGHLKEIL